MSGSPNALLQQQVELIANAGYPNAEISVLNGSYEVVAQAIGELRMMLDPGLYKIRYRAGNTMNEELVELAPQKGPVILAAPKWSIRTAAPISDSASSSPAVENAAKILSAQPGLCTEGSGARIFVFVRGPQPGEQDVPGNPARGLQLLDFAGKLLVDFSERPPIDGCVGCNVELNPGSYLLRLELADGEALEQTIVASEGWQTLVFLPLAHLSACDTAWRPDLSNAAVLMSLGETGFDPKTEEYAWVETARQELAIGRPVVPEQRIRAAIMRANTVSTTDTTTPADVREMLHTKFPNPILAIFGAHKIMMSPNPDIDLLNELANNLRRLVGDHPDVMSIYLWLDPTANVPAYYVPPMLRSSWAILVNRSRNREDVVRPGSYALRVSDRLWGAGAWMVWRRPEAPAPPPSAPPPAAVMASPASGLSTLLAKFSFSSATPSMPDLGAIFQWARQQVAASTGSEVIRRGSETMGLSGLERDVFAYIVHLAEQQKFIQDVTSSIASRGVFSYLTNAVQKVVGSDVHRNAAALVGNLSKDRMVENLGVPQAALTDAIASLTTKFAARQKQLP